MPEGSDEYSAAHRLGRLLVEAGYAVINGGQTGTMDGVARGVAEAGGRCLGITVRGAPWAAPTGYLSELRLADDLFLRARELLMLSAAWVALPGQVGTLAEVAIGWALVGGRLIEPRPLILVGRPWLDTVPRLAAGLGIGDDLVRLLTLVETVDEAVTRLGAILLS